MYRMFHVRGVQRLQTLYIVSNRNPKGWSKQGPGLFISVMGRLPLSRKSEGYREISEKPESRKNADKSQA